MSKEAIRNELSLLTGNDAFALHRYAKALQRNNLEVLSELDKELERIATSIDDRADRIRDALDGI